MSLTFQQRRAGLRTPFCPQRDGRPCPQRDGSLAHRLTPSEALFNLNAARLLVSGHVYSFRHEDAERKLRYVSMHARALLPWLDDPQRQELRQVYATVELARVALQAPEPDYPQIARLITTAMEFAARWLRAEGEGL